MSANKNANKRQRVDYFASSLFFLCELTHSFLLLLFDVIISNKYHFAFGTARVLRNRSQTVCSVFSVHPVTVAVLGSGCDGVLVGAKIISFVFLLIVSFPFYHSPFNPNNIRDWNQKKKRNKILKFLRRKFPR